MGTKPKIKKLWQAQGSSLEDFTFIQEQADVKIVLACHDSTQPLVEEDVVKAFEHSPFYKAYLNRELLAGIVEQANEFIDEVKEELSPPGEFSEKIATIRDGVITISIGSDKMTAKAKIEMAWGGEEVTMEDLKKECQNMGVSFGVKKSKCEKLLSKTFEAEPGDMFEETIAVGKEPKNGKNAYFRPLVELFSDKIRRPTEIDGGKVDLKDLGDIETVKPGERIFRKFPLTNGTDGKNVLGEVLPATPGKDLLLETSPGTVIDKRNHNILLARREGLARVIDNRMEVDDVYTLPELTPKQGHVKFNGTVMIAGDVSPEMKIIATGDVIIGGFVEQASIRCRGELTIISGASGKPLDYPNDERQFNCLLESGYRVNLAFANQVDIIAKRDVFVHKQLSHCNVRASSMRVGQGEVPHGKLIGGKHFLSKGLELGQLGAPSGTHTSICLNRSYDVFKQKEEVMWQQIEPHMEQLERLKTRLKALISDEQRAECKEEILNLQYKIERMSGKRKTFIQRRRDYMNAVKVQINHTLFSGISFEIADKTKANDRERGPSVVHLNEHQLDIDPKSS